MSNSMRLGDTNVMELGGTTVGELDTASIATAYHIWHIRLLSFPLYCLQFEIMVQQMTLRSFVKRLGNLTHRRVSHQAGLIKQALKHQALKLVSKTIKGLHSTGFLLWLSEVFQLG